MANAEILIYKNEQLFTHTVAYIYTAEVSQVVAKSSGLSICKKTQLSTQELAPDLLPILKHLYEGKTHIVLSIDA